MRRIFFIVVLSTFIFIERPIAQTITLPDITSPPCQGISVAIVASGFPTDMAAVQFFLPVDTNVLAYTGYTPGTIPPTSFINYDPDNAQVGLVWSATSPTNINGTLVTLHFNYKGGNSILTIINYEFSRTNLTTVNPAIVNGSVGPATKTTYYVDYRVAVSGTGLSWGTALKTITEATNKSLTPGDEVLVWPGTYNEALVIKTNGSELVPVTYNVSLSDTNKITFPSGTDLSCVSPASYPGKYYAYVFRSWKCNNGAYPILSVNDAEDYVIVDNAAFMPETGASGDTSLLQASIGMPVFYKKYSSNPETERVIVNTAGVGSSKANCYIGTPIGTGDSATAANYNIIDGFDLTGSATNKTGLRIQSSSFNVFRNGRVYNLDTVGVYISGSSLKPARYNILDGNKIYNTFQRAIKIGKHGGSTGNSNYAYFTLIKGNKIYVENDAGSSNDRLWNMLDVHPKTAFTMIEGNTFRSYDSQSAGKGTVEIWDNVRKTNISCNFFRDIGKAVSGTNSIVYIRNSSLDINVFNNVLLKSSLMNDDIYAFRFNGAGHSGSKAVYNTVLNVDNGILFEDIGVTPPVFLVQNNILYINYSGGGAYFTSSGTTGRFTVSHNCYPSVPTAPGDPYHSETGRQVGDPQFVNPSFFSSPHGVQLKTGSVCISNGTSVSVITTDYVQDTRQASNPTIGAFESVLVSCSWTGNVSQDWHNYLNWSPELVPTSFIQAVIPLKSNLPVVSVTDAVCKGLQLEDNATVNVNNGRLLTVY